MMQSEFQNWFNWFRCGGEKEKYLYQPAAIIKTNSELGRIMFLDFVHCLIFLKKQNVSEADPVSETF
jgi:hypothetical protein